MPTSSCIEFSHRPAGLAKIFLLAFFFAAFTFATTLYFNRQIIVDNWELYKCYPLVTMSAEMFGKNSADTMAECQNRTYQCASPKMVKPVVKVFEEMSNTFGGLDFMIGDLDQLGMSGTNLISEKFKLVLSKLKLGSSAIDFIIVKIEAVFKRILSSMVVMLYSAFAMVQGIKVTAHDSDLLSIVDYLMD